jgi:hypothetical protein
VGNVLSQERLHIEKPNKGFSLEMPKQHVSGGPDHSGNGGFSVNKVPRTMWRLKDTP